MITMMFLIGLISGIITGLLSVGGGIITIFSLILLPPLITQTTFTMQTIASFSIMQAFFSTLSGAYYYFRERIIDKGVVLYLGVPSLFGGGIGVLLAHQTSDFILRIVFSLLSIVAAIVMMIPYKSNENENFIFSVKSYLFSIAGGLSIGIVGGLIGLSAGFIFVPVMIFFYHLNIKKAIGTSLITCFLLAGGSFVAKIAMGALSLNLGLALIVGGMIGAQIGGRISKKLQPIALKRIAAYAIILVCVKMVYDLFFHLIESSFITYL